MSGYGPTLMPLCYYGPFAISKRNPLRGVPVKFSREPSDLRVRTLSCGRNPVSTPGTDELDKVVNGGGKVCHVGGSIVGWRLPRLMTGENSCEWAVWFKAHHQNWAKVPSDFNQAEWMLNRTSLLNEKKSQWEARRQKVYVEGQNSFRLRGQSATLAGRPDLIVVRSNDALIIDIKAGREQPAHFVQIMIYMYALPRALQQFQHAKLAGEIVYPTRTARVPMGSLHTQFKTDLGSLIRRIAADKPAARVPSEHE